MSNPKYAHTVPNCSDRSQWQTLEEHLNETASLATTFAESFDSLDWARNAALLHDLGKLDDRFQKKLFIGLHKKSGIRI